MRPSIIAAHAAFFLALSPLLAQSPALPVPPASGAAAATEAPEALEGLPRGFRGIELGMSVDQVQTLLKGEELLAWRGPADVSLLPRPDETLLDVPGSPRSYLKRAWFQFYEDRLWTMTFVMDEGRVDHYSIFTQLSEKYGKPGSLSPKESVWADAATRVSLERPLSVKYLDLEVFERLKAAGEVQVSVEELERQDFLGGF